MKHATRLWVSAVSTAITIGLGTAAYAALSSPSDAHVGFRASGPAGLKIEGTTTDLEVGEKDGAISIKVPLANLTTGIALRDRHMKEKYLEVQTFPAATLTVSRTDLKLPPAGARSEGDVAGTLTLHGQTKPVKLHYDAKSDGAGFAVNGGLHLKMDDFGITVPTYLGVTVKPDVDVSASFHVAGN